MGRVGLGLLAGALLLVFAIPAVFAATRLGGDEFNSIPVPVAGSQDDQRSDGWQHFSGGWVTTTGWKSYHTFDAGVAPAYVGADLYYANGQSVAAFLTSASTFDWGGGDTTHVVIGRNVMHVGWVDSYSVADYCSIACNVPIPNDQRKQVWLIWGDESLTVWINGQTWSYDHPELSRHGQAVTVETWGGEGAWWNWVRAYSQ